MDILLTITVIFIVGTTYVYHCRTVPQQVKKVKCRSNLGRLYQALIIYSNNYHGGKYPVPDKWCDLLIKSGANSDDSDIFACPAAKTPDYIEQCHYAINPNAKLQSSPDMVLLFETKVGWNQSGGPELMTFENHDDKGCHVLFNNGSVEFITPEQAEELKWKDDVN